jgi:wyosine [tRNA(Phe)-imidazoG37] synthetase (radical SAM superfamily)
MGLPDQNSMNPSFRYIYGPIYSWRLGQSLGIDPLSQKEKICNFDCIYCQLGRSSRLYFCRGHFVAPEDLAEELKRIPADATIDHLTFSGRGEPTLAKNLGQLIKTAKRIRPEKVAVITNSSLLDREDVREDLSHADVVLAKLDACSDQSFLKVDGMMSHVSFQKIVNGILKFRRSFKGKLALQVMFMEENYALADQIGALARVIAPEEVQLSTPVRACRIPALSQDRMEQLKIFFKDIPVVSVYDSPGCDDHPLDIRSTVLRHGRKAASSINAASQ